MIDYSYYPFLKGSLQHRHITDFNEQSILYAQDNIEKYTPIKQLELDTQVWLISTIMLRCLNNNFITRKFVSNYSKLFESHLTKDFKNKEVRMEILDFFISNKKDVKFMPIGNSKKQQEEFVSIHVMDYLEILEKTDSLPAPQFHLVNQILYKGFIYLEYQRFIYLLRLALEHRLYQKIRSMSYYNGNELINKIVEELKQKYPEYKPKKVEMSTIPITIKELISKAYEEHHLGHAERIKLGLFLMRNNFDWNFIIEIFSQLSDFSLKTTTYQLNSLKKYIKS